MPTQSQGKRRNVNEPTEKPVKRTRVSRACDQCRTAREKCDGIQPTCSTCSASRRECAYRTNPKKRGIQPGYIRSLELALVWLFQQNPENESILNDKLSQEGTSSLFLSRESREATKLHKRWRKARFYTEVDRLLSGGEPPRHEQNESNSTSSEDDESDPELPRAANIAKPREPTQDDAPPPGPNAQTDFQQHHKVASNHLVVMPSDSWSLFDLYFTYTQAWLPICEKHDILKLSYSYPEEGLPLASDQGVSGSHAEMWSILAVASLYNDSPATPSCQSSQSPTRPTRLYKIARSLVPTELGRFDLEHVKALLNLTLFHIVLSRLNPAWLLIGHASRILESTDTSNLIAGPRHKHVFAGCFLLDSMLATQLGRRPHFRKTDLDHLGKIDEDGLEEWQPWYGHSPSLEQMRMPMLAMSNLNSLLGLVDILANLDEDLVANGCGTSASNRIKTWETSLPSKLGYIHSDVTATGLSPPVVLLQLTYYCVLFLSNPSAQELRRVLRVMERYKALIGLKAVPPVIQCLLGIIEKKSVQSKVATSILTHLRKLRDEVASIWSCHVLTDSTQSISHENSPWLTAFSEAQFPQPEPPPTLLPTMQPVHQANATPIIPHDSTAILQEAQIAMDLQLAIPSPAASDPRYPEVNSDLEIFFDELASLDSTNRLDTQPQFMQNLGFAPDASMADLFSEYISTQSTAFVAQEDLPVADFDQYQFYNAG
ncbi:hypothetical protein NX059_006380 [Plenodomus lindquistii]|nr:hypothetical protein NX059_006380 [Plenodomus lindquistii]